MYNHITNAERFVVGQAVLFDIHLIVGSAFWGRGREMEESKMVEMMAEIMQTLKSQGEILRRLEEAQQQHTAILQEHTAVLGEHGNLLRGECEDLRKIKLRMENDLYPKLDMLFEGQVNLAEQRDRDQFEVLNRMKDVEDRTTILAVQVEDLKKAQ